MGFALLMVGGCSSPPSVVPLLRVVDQAMANAHDQLEVDRQRAAANVSQQRQALTAGFDADLEAQTTLTAQWVRDHAMVYAVAREALAGYEMRVEREYDQRQANLRDARRANHTAMTLIEQQDALFQAVPDARRWLHDSTNKEQR